MQYIPFPDTTPIRNTDYSPASRLICQEKAELACCKKSDHKENLYFPSRPVTAHYKNGQDAQSQRQFCKNPFLPQAVLPPWQNCSLMASSSSTTAIFKIHRLEFLTLFNLSADFLLFWDAGNEMHIKWNEIHKSKGFRNPPDTGVAVPARRRKRSRVFCQFIHDLIHQPFHIRFQIAVYHLISALAIFMCLERMARLERRSAIHSLAESYPGLAASSRRRLTTWVHTGPESAGAFSKD